MNDERSQNLSRIQRYSNSSHDTTTNREPFNFDERSRDERQRCYHVNETRILIRNLACRGVPIVHLITV